MKAFKILAIGLMLILAGSAQSQLSVNVHIGTPPAWGPSGYSNVRYYYLPDVQAYYDVQTSMFIYIAGNQWVHRTYLPARYRNYDLYNGYKVVMNDYRGNTPYSHFKEHRVKYSKGYRGEFQKTNGERRDNNYNQRNAHSATQPVRNVYENNDRRQVQKSEGNRSNSNDKAKQKDQKGGHDNGKGDRK